MRSSLFTRLPFSSFAYTTKGLFYGLVSLFILGQFGCGKPDVTGPACQKNVCTEKKDTSFRTIVDATDKKKWVYFSLLKRQAVTVQDASKDTSWDIAFRRADIKTNGGVSGPGKVRVAWVDNQDLTQIKKAPTDGYHQDKAGSEYAFAQQGKWYNYDLGKHILTPKNRVYILQRAEHTYLIKIYSYYSHTSVSGHPSFDWITLSK